MTTKTLFFEGQTNGTTVSNTNSDDFGDSALNLANIAAGNTCTYSTDFAYPGTVSVKYATGASGFDYMELAGFSSNSMSQQFYIYITDTPSQDTTIATFRTGAAQISGLNITTGRVFQVTRSGGTVVFTGSTQIPTNQWVRVNFACVVATTTTGQANLAWYSTPGGPTATETYTSGATLNMGTTALTIARLGKNSNASNWATTFYVDSWRVQDGTSTFFGPLVSDVSGTVAGVSAASGTVTLIGAASGTAAAVSAASGAPVLLAAASGTIAALSTATADVASVQQVTGATAAVSAVSGTVALLAAVSGQIDAVSAVTGAVTVVPAASNTYDISGTVEAVSGGSADVAAVRVVSGTVAAVSDSSATVAGLYPATGTVTAASSSTGAMTGLFAAVGQVDGISTVTAGVAALYPITGSADAASDTTGYVAAILAVTGTADAVSTVVGAVYVAGSLHDTTIAVLLARNRLTATLAANRVRAQLAREPQ